MEHLPDLCLIIRIIIIIITIIIIILIIIQSLVISVIIPSKRVYLSSIPDNIFTFSIIKLLDRTFFIIVNDHWQPGGTHYSITYLQHPKDFGKNGTFVW